MMTSKHALRHSVSIPNFPLASETSEAQTPKPKERNMKVIHTRRALSAALTTVLVLGAFVGNAFADNGGPDAIRAVNRAAKTEGLQPATGKLDVARAGNQLQTASDGIALAVPAGKTTSTTSGTVVEGSGQSKIVFQQVGREYRASIQIANATDPERYEFNVVGAAALLPQTDGSVLAVDASDKPIAEVAAAWARDRNGEAVPTRYEIDGTKLIQIVKHKGMGFAYGITADPGFWQICGCAGAIAWTVGTNLIVPARILRLKKTLNALGGAWNAAKLLLGAGTWPEKLAVFGEAGAGAAAEFLGVKQIRDNC